MAKLSLAKLERHLYSAADRLRQEGLDAATYKDYIFGLLFLKRCSDVVEAERERIVGRKVEQGMFKEIAETQYGENPDFYDGFFVPERARGDYLLTKLADATEPYGSVLDKALGALSQANESLEHVLDHISFRRVQSNKRIVSDDACKDLVRHFSRSRLRTEDFQFSDLLGAAYEFLINMFAESAGKKGGDFYTPREVIRLMVRILKPRPGLSVYDPTCGSGGMLIISREFVEHSGGDFTNLQLCGQVNDASAWSICKLNMLLHGVPGADIRLEDTLLHPQHREAGELERFDRVIANPPFSQNYTRNNMEYPERFRWGWCPTTGKKGDLMFAQHMLAVCKPGGEEDSSKISRTGPHRGHHRPTPEPVLRRRYPGLHPGDATEPQRPITDPEFEQVLQAQTSSRARAAQMQHAARSHLIGFSHQNPAYARKMSEKLEEILQRFKDDWDALERELRKFIEELRQGDRNEFPDLDPRAQVPFVRLLLEEYGKGRQLTDAQRSTAIAATLDIVERIRQEVRKVGFWKNPAMREQLTRALVRDLDAAGICQPGAERDLAQQLVALAKENHENLTRP